jgi:four helix bundle protein
MEIQFLGVYFTLKRMKFLPFLYKMVFSFEKLEAWQEAKGLVKHIYLLSALLPNQERFTLIDQMRRAAISITSNLAEGSGRITPKDKSHFYAMAYSSLLELLNHVLISGDLGYINTSQINESRERIEKVSRIINGLRKSQHPKPLNL